MSTKDNETGVDADLATLLASGDVKSALLLKGDFTDQERELIRQAYEAGLAHGSGRVEAELSRLRQENERLKLDPKTHPFSTGMDAIARAEAAEASRDRHAVEVATLGKRCADLQQDRDEWKASADSMSQDLRTARDRCARLQQALERIADENDPLEGIGSEMDFAREALAGPDTPADSQETLTVWWWPKGLGVEYDIPVPYERKLDAESALALAEQLSRVEGMQFVKVFGQSEHDVRWRYPADSQPEPVDPETAEYWRQAKREAERRFRERWGDSQPEEPT